MRAFLVTIAIVGACFALLAWYPHDAEKRENLREWAARTCRSEASADSQKDCIDRKMVAAAIARQK